MLYTQLLTFTHTTLVDTLSHALIKLLRRIKFEIGVGQQNM
jgi:hypothetical protein